VIGETAEMRHRKGCASAAGQQNWSRSARVG